MVDFDRKNDVESTEMVTIPPNMRVTKSPYEKLYELKRLFPMFSGVDVIISNKTIGGLIDESLGVTYKLDNYSEIRFENMGRYSPYEFKVKIYHEESRYWYTTFYSILNGHNDISLFIRRSGEMKSGEHKVDPLEYGESHHAIVFFESNSLFPPIGIEELLDKTKENPKTYLRLVVREHVVDRLIR